MFIIITIMSFKPSPQFVNDIQEWDRLHNLIKKYETSLKDLRKEKKKLQESTMMYMETNDFEKVNVVDGSIKFKSSRRKVSSLTKKKLPLQIADFFIEKRDMDPIMAKRHAEEIVEYVDSKAEHVPTKTLIRYKNKNATEENE